ncbi:MAG: hypothetical protein M1834_004545 [Cirrosporium novae-zelandiae]|nr:MAG: hypothetical protein M1834_004545 [Cirrosporium novae-zelandiae]
MSNYQRLPELESQPTTTRRRDDPEYSDDPEFKRVAEEISYKLVSLTSNISRLSNQIALLGTKRETERVRERVQDLLEDTKDGFKEVGEGIKRIQSWENTNPHQRYTQQKLSREFGASLQEFQTTQRSALEKLRASQSAARAAAAAEGETSGGRPPSPQQTQQQQQQLQEQIRLAPQDEVDFQESLIIERESEIRNIEQSVGELHELFRDVAVLVNDQGQQLDDIYSNVDNTRMETQGADRELRSASRYQKNARSKACCLLLILAVILVIVVLAVVLG